jgi:hypothetical protein
LIGYFEQFKAFAFKSHFYLPSPFLTEKEFSETSKNIPDYLNKWLTAAIKQFSLAPYCQSRASLLSIIEAGDYSD